MRLASRGRKRDELLSCLSSPVTTNQARQTRFAGNKRGHVDIVAPDEPALRAAIERANAMPESKSVCIKLTASTV